jgi:hypothetical protein
MAGGRSLMRHFDEPQRLDRMRPRLAPQPEAGRPGVAIDGALCDRNLLGAALGDPKTWSNWLTVLRAAFGLPLDAAQREVFTQIAGPRDLPTRRLRELWCVVGRRGGKSRAAAAIAVYLALFCRHPLSRGETGMVLVLAASTAQARIVFDYCLGFIEASPVLRHEIKDATRTEIRLRNGIVIATHSNSYRNVRGRTLLGVIFDEVSFWPDEGGALSDIEAYRAVLPSLLTTNGMLVAISTPYRKLGLLYQKHRDHYGVPSDDVLCVQGSSQTFNSTLTDDAIDAQREADPVAAGAEWDALFRTDIGQFLDEELIERAIDYGRPLELPPHERHRCRAFVDASGGRHDHYTIAVGYKEVERYVVAVCRGARPPFDPSVVTQEFAALAREYGVGSVIGDSYGAEWVQSAWRAAGIGYQPSDIPKGAIYLETLPLWTRGLISLPGHKALIRELRLLERHTHRSGKDTVDHGRNGSDDHANAVCGLLRTLVARAPLRISPEVMRWSRIPQHGAYGGGLEHSHGGPISW